MSMLDSLILNIKSIESIYQTIYEFHNKYLKQFGVKLPKLYNFQNKFSKDAVILDPFIGSGTTALAAKKLGKNILGLI